MKFNLYSIYDRKMGIYLSPFPGRGHVDATRSIVSGMPQMKDTPVGQNPQDFDLTFIGCFNDDNGEISRCTPEVLGSVS